MGRIDVPHFLARQDFRTKGVKPQFPRGIVSSVHSYPPVAPENHIRDVAEVVVW
jgi:hypothetical protein